jgi:hypothetical protein
MSKGSGRTIRKKYQSPGYYRETVIWEFEVIAEFKDNDILDKAFITITKYDTAVSQDYELKVDVSLWYSNRIELYVTRRERYTTGMEEHEHKLILETTDDLRDLEILRRETYESINGSSDVYDLLTKISYELSNYYTENIGRLVNPSLQENYDAPIQAYVVFGKDDVMELAQASMYDPEHKAWLELTISFKKGLDMLLEKKAVGGYSKSIKKHRVYVESSLLKRDDFKRRMFEYNEVKELVKGIISHAIHWIYSYIYFTLKDEMTTWTE